MIQMSLKGGLLISETAFCWFADDDQLNADLAAL